MNLEGQKTPPLYSGINIVVIVGTQCNYLGGTQKREFAKTRHVVGVVVKP